MACRCVDKFKRMQPNIKLLTYLIEHCASKSGIIVWKYYVSYCILLSFQEFKFVNNNFRKSSHCISNDNAFCTCIMYTTCTRKGFNKNGLSVLYVYKCTSLFCFVFYSWIMLEALSIYLTCSMSGYYVEDKRKKMFDFLGKVLLNMRNWAVCWDGPNKCAVRCFMERLICLI